MFIDKAQIKVISGSGGNGAVAWRREKYVDKGGPAGGDGGRGGDVYLVASESLSTLLDFKYKSKFAAQIGENGQKKNCHGKCGKDLFIHVPLGTVVRDMKTGKVIGDIKHHDEKLLLAKGGRGGRGNARFATSTRRTPQFCEPGESGIERDIELELKLIAEVGLLGMPNAGKSTFISSISAAKPKIADYPFTTLVPNLGVVQKPDGDSFVVADIPGLIEGASDGVGLGYAFLRHVERTKFLMHIVDMTTENPVRNFDVINAELAKYNDRLAHTYQLVVLNKSDAVDEERIQELKKEFGKKASDVFVISAVTHKGVDELMNFVFRKVEEIPAPEIEVEVEEDDAAYNNDDSEFHIYKGKDSYYVTGGKVERIASVTDITNIEQLHRFYNILKAMGIIDALVEKGIKDEDIIQIGKVEFVYYSDDV